VSDNRFSVVTSKGADKEKKGASASNLLVSTVGDELRMATGGQSKVWGLSLKDRAAILMSGHLANGVLWFTDNGGEWISSTYFFTNGMLPAWTRDLNTTTNAQGKRFIDQFVTNVWKFGFTNASEQIWTRTNEFISTSKYGLLGSFEHVLTNAPPTNATTAKGKSANSPSSNSTSTNLNLTNATASSVTSTNKETKQK
jgi:hypothetical protein